MKIESYKFGHITVDGQSFTNDVIIFNDKIIDSWWRKQGHKLAYEDLDRALQENKPDIVIIGTGKFGVMKVPEKVRQKLESQGYEVRIEKTDTAVDMFNNQVDRNKVGAALHLTC